MALKTKGSELFSGICDFLCLLHLVFLANQSAC